MKNRVCYVVWANIKLHFTFVRGHIIINTKAQVIYHISSLRMFKIWESVCFAMAVYLSLIKN